MVEITALTTFYSFLLAILIFLASKYLETLESVRKLVVNNIEHIKGVEQHYKILRGGMHYKIFIGILIVSGIGIDSYLLINTIFPNFIIPLLDLILIVIVALSIILIFLEQIVNIMKIIDVAYKGTIDEEIEKLTK